MFCSKCGEQLGEDVVFCPKCGTKSVTGGTTDNRQNSNQSIDQLSIGQIPKQKRLKPLMVLSIIGFVIFPLGFASFFGIENNDDVYAIVFTYFGFALAHAIVALVMAIKFRLKATKVMAIIGLAWYSLGAITIISTMEYEPALAWTIMGMGYAIALSIVSFVQAKKKNIS